MMNNRTRYWVVLCYAAAMAWAEAAVVFYLRTLVHRVDPYQPAPLPEISGLAFAEVVREGATMVMLATVAWLSGKDFRSRFAYFIVAFGIWDILYYLFLRILTGWPRTLLDWDILFLIPLPWWGPVIAPMLVALLMVSAGTLLLTSETPLRPSLVSLSFCLLGILFVLTAFMYDALALCVSGANAEAIRNWLPHSFSWWLFASGYLLAAVPVIDLGLQHLARNGLQPAIDERITP